MTSDSAATYWKRYWIYVGKYLEAKHILAKCEDGGEYDYQADIVDYYRSSALDEKLYAKLYEELEKYKCPECGEKLAIDYQSDGNDFYDTWHQYYIHCQNCYFSIEDDNINNTEKDAVKNAINYFENHET